MEKLKVLIKGSTSYNDYENFKKQLEHLGLAEQDCIILTDLSFGIGRMALDYGRSINKEIWIYPEDKEGIKMLKIATHCLVFNDNTSSTSNFIELAKQTNLKLLIFDI